MESLLPFTVLLFLTFRSAAGNSCGGLLEGEIGHLSLANASNQEEPGTPSSFCFWIIQLHYENNIRFTLDALSKDDHLNLYPEDQLASCGLSNYTMLNWTHVGSSLNFPGKTLIAILPNSSASVAFSWHFIPNEDKNSSVAVMKNSDYIVSPNGLLEWAQLETEERVTWGINANSNIHIKWDVDVATPCEAVDNCACFHFAILQITSEGVLSEAVRTCGLSSEGKIERISGRAVVLMKVNTEVEANQIAVSWGVDEPVPPMPTDIGLFAATTAGIIALNLQTLETVALTNESTYAVAVNHNLQKVYWTEIGGNCSIVRSNFDGSDREIIVPPTGEGINTLAIHEQSGNIYFGLNQSNKIKICNALGENCSEIISNSSFVNAPHGMALDAKNSLMYWSSPGTPGGSIVRANLDGSNAAIISTGYGSLTDITLAPPSNEILYWVDAGENIIGTIDVNGDSKRTLIELDGPPFGIQVDADKVYFGDNQIRTLYSANKDSGENHAALFNSTAGFHDLALFNVPAKKPCLYSNSC